MSAKKTTKKDKATPLQAAAGSYQAAYWRMIGKCGIHMARNAGEHMTELMQAQGLRLPPGVRGEDALVLAHTKDPRDCDPEGPDGQHLRKELLKSMGMETPAKGIALARATWRSVLEPVRDTAARFADLMHRQRVRIADMRAAHTLAGSLKLGCSSLPNQHLLEAARDLFNIASHVASQTAAGTLPQDATKVKLTDLDRKSIEVLRRAGGALKLNELYTRTGQTITDEAFRKRMSRLRRLAIIEGNGRGRYWYPKTGQKSG